MRHTKRRRILIVVAISATVFAEGCYDVVGYVTEAPPPGDEIVDASSNVKARAHDTVCTNHCSSDLHRVLDCHGQTVTTCDGEQGCAGGGCIPSCEAAAAAQGSLGCEYYSVDPAEFNENVGACFAAFVTNPWNTDIALGVEYAGEALDVSAFARLASGSGPSIVYEALPNGKLPPGKTAILFLAHHPEGTTLTSCPNGIVPAIHDTNVKIVGTGWAHAFRITSSHPVTAYDTYSYDASGALTSATLLLPTPGWGTSYIVQAPFTNAPSTGSQMQLFVQIVGKEERTTVRITPRTAIVGNADAGVAATAAGEGATYTLKRGDVLQLSQSEELTGSRVESDHPIGVWGGANCINIPWDNLYCDSAHQQIPPTSALGNEYAAAPHGPRHWFLSESPPWRIVGVRDGTVLEYAPTRPASAPATIDEGQIATFVAAQPFVVRSQDAEHPFYVSAHMTGGSRYQGYGDPEWVHVVPTGQFLSSYTFYTNPTFPETSLVIVRPKAGDKFHDVVLDCAGPVDSWAPIDADDQFEYGRVILSQEVFASNNGCANGTHTISSDTPFGVVVWGWGNGETTTSTANTSYAFPAGAGLRRLNYVDLSGDGGSP